MRKKQHEFQSQSFINKGTARAFPESRHVLWVARRQVAIRSGGGLFSKKSNQTLYITKKIKTIMEKLEEYDVIAQSIEIPEDTIKQSRISCDELKLRAYVMSELTRQMTEKLIKSGYITETWIKKEGSEECTLTLYVKPLIKKY